MTGRSLVKRISTERGVSNSFASRNLNNEEAWTKQFCPTMTYKKKRLLAHCSNRLVQRKECLSQFTLSCSYRCTCVTILNKCRQIRSYTWLLKMIVGVLTTCHKQYTWDNSICIFLFNRTTLQVFVTYLTGALYVHPLWFYKHQHDNRVRSTQNAFSLPFAAILVHCAPSGETHNYCTPHIINENSENFLIHRGNYILLSQVYCVWQVVKTPTIIFNNSVLLNHHSNTTIRNCNMFQPLKGHLQGVQFIHSSNINVTQYTLHTKLSFTTDDTFCWTTLLEYVNHIPWGWHFKLWNMLQLHILLTF